MNIEIIRNTLYKAYLEDFYNFCLSLGGPTADVMHDVLSVSLYNYYTSIVVVTLIELICVLM